MKRMSKFDFYEFEKGFNTFLGYDCDDIYTPDEALEYIETQNENLGNTVNYKYLKEELEKLSDDPEIYIDMNAWECYGEHYLLTIEDLYLDYAAEYYPEVMSDDDGYAMIFDYVHTGRHTMWDK